MADQPDPLSEFPAGPDYESSDRVHYFTGQFLTARDLACDQGFHVARHRLHQRLLHGWGVACGLGVRLRDDVPLPCKGYSISVSPGLALDCRGRDLILAAPRQLDLRNLPSEDDPQNVTPSKLPFLLCASYAVEGVEEVPVLYADGRRAPTAWNRLREGVTFVKRTRVTRECWPDLWANSHELKLPDSCGPGSGSGNCLDPHCACGATVPLALVVPKLTEDNLTGYDVYTDNRRLLPRPVLPQDLTHVRATTWTHGVPMALCDLRDKYHWTLKIQFDRPLDADPGPGRGVNDQTFEVSCTDPGDARRLLRLPGRAALTDEGMTAEYTLRHDCHDLLRSHGKHPHLTIWVTLRCDFIPDHHGRAVDGNFIGHGGPTPHSFPTGDGVAGGTFESWFDLTI